MEGYRFYNSRADSFNKFTILLPQGKMGNHENRENFRQCV